MSEGYVTQSKLKKNSAVCEAEENNLPLPQTKTSDGSEEALAGTAVTLSLLSPSTNNSPSKNLSQTSAKNEMLLPPHTLLLLRLL